MVSMHTQIFSLIGTFIRRALNFHRLLVKRIAVRQKGRTKALSFV